ncbi:MAG: AAA-like domain-containing protein [Clostridiales bacterium]|nr:AAA-like domain-containing protein [Clostridiales bacterium]
MRRFNVTGVCVPEKHYMVDISGKLVQIREMVDRGDYFTINRARQYGKTTTLSLLKKILREDYIVASISFEGLGDNSFASDEAFCAAFIDLVYEALAFSDVPDGYKESWLDTKVTDFRGLSRHITTMCRPDAIGAGKRLVLMIDEVDKTSNNRTYLHFLGLLRDKYLRQQQSEDYTFHSVILAGVYDIRNIKLRMINEGVYLPAATENAIYNSPWNIAADFRVDMSFSPDEIATMLTDYDADHGTGMDIHALAGEIHSFTSGYPFLVSRICQIVDSAPEKDWTPRGVQKALSSILRERNTLFDDLYKNMENNQGLYDLLYDVLMLGKKRTYVVGSPAVDIADIYGIIKETDQGVAVSNRIFELVICNYFIAKDEALPKRRITSVLQEDVVDGGHFDMELCLRKFAEHYAEIFSERDAAFLEREGRLLFLSYLKPLINGQGFYHIESQFTDLRRMDVVVDFGADQFIIELKLWKGEAAHERAYEQLAGYLGSKGATEGYLLTFDFRKGVEKQPRAEWVDFDGKRLFDVIAVADNA